MKWIHLSSFWTRAGGLGFSDCVSVCLAGILLLGSGWFGAAAGDNLGPNILPAGSFDNGRFTYIPWAGVDDRGNLHGIEGSALAAGEDGSVHRHTFGPSIAVGDLNGDGKPDLVLADSRGYFWFYPNSGTAKQSVFTQGEVMPIWLGELRVDGSFEAVDNVVPRIQLVDFDHTRRLDIVAGTYDGKLFCIPNTGSPTQPSFKPTYDLNGLLINTRKQGLLWCNYLAPCFTTLFSNQRVYDLIMGEGTYSANSIYLLHNTSSRGSPTFDEEHFQRIIPGMGVEQLTPIVVDWNNDGKPDVLSGDRTGFLNLYLNTTTDPANPTFAPGTHIKIGGQEKLGNSTTLALGDLTGNGLPNLLIGRDDGTVLYALNTGKIGAPVFNTPATPLKGVLPPSYHHVGTNDWVINGAWGAPDEILSYVNPQVEPGFTFPEGEKSHYALKFSVWPIRNTYFPEKYYPKVEDKWTEHVVFARQQMMVKLNKRYRVHFWIKAEGNISDFRYKLSPAPFQHRPFVGYPITNPVDVGTTWTEATSEIEVSNPNDPTISAWPYGIEFRFTGQTTFYIDDLSICEKL